VAAVAQFGAGDGGSYEGASSGERTPTNVAHPDGLALALIVSIAVWVVFVKAWTPSPVAPAPRFVLPSSTGETVAFKDFLGKQDVVLVFYMVAT
jgi:hypothetical protein